MTKYIGLIKSKAFLRIAALVVSTYFICMVLAPPILGGWSWDYVQAVWDRWQTLNAAMLAFVSSVIAFNISAYNAEEQRGREFVSARAFLPHALSDLTTYCQESATSLVEALQQLRNQQGDRELLRAKFPNLPDNYKEVFSSCIKHAEPNVGNYLAKILMLLQIHHSRLRYLVDSFAQKNSTVVARRNIVIYMHELGKIQALVNRLFGFARGEKAFDDAELVYEDYTRAYLNLNLRGLEIEELFAYTKEKVSGHELTA